MKHTLKELYDGTLIPGEQVKCGREAEQLIQAEKRLRAVLPAEGIPLLEAYETIRLSLTGSQVEYAYLSGFKTGARLMLEVLDDSSGEAEL